MTRLVENNGAKDSTANQSQGEHQRQLTQSQRPHRQQSRCYLCETPKAEYSLVSTFGEIVCRGCVNFEGPDRVGQLIASARKFKASAMLDCNIGNNGISPTNDSVLNSIRSSIESPQRIESPFFAIGIETNGKALASSQSRHSPVQIQQQEKHQSPVSPPASQTTSPTSSPPTMEGAAQTSAEVDVKRLQLESSQQQAPPSYQPQSGLPPFSRATQAQQQARNLVRPIPPPAQAMQAPVFTAAPHYNHLLGALHNPHTAAAAAAAYCLNAAHFGPYQEAGPYPVGQMPGQAAQLDPCFMYNQSIRRLLSGNAYVSDPRHRISQTQAPPQYYAPEQFGLASGPKQDFELVLNQDDDSLSPKILSLKPAPGKLDSELTGESLGASDSGQRASVHACPDSKCGGTKRATAPDYKLTPISPAPKRGARQQQPHQPPQPQPIESTVPEPNGGLRQHPFQRKERILKGLMQQPPRDARGATNPDAQALARLRQVSPSKHDNKEPESATHLSPEWPNFCKTSQAALELAPPKPVSRLQQLQRLPIPPPPPARRPVEESRCLSCGQQLSNQHFIQCPTVEVHKFCFACSKNSIEKQRNEGKKLKHDYEKSEKCFLPNESAPWTFMNNEIETIFRESNRQSATASMQPPTTPLASNAGAPVGVPAAEKVANASVSSSNGKNSSSFDSGVAQSAGRSLTSFGGNSSSGGGGSSNNNNKSMASRDKADFSGILNCKQPQQQRQSRGLPPPQSSSSSSSSSLSSAPSGSSSSTSTSSMSPPAPATKSSSSSSLAAAAAAPSNHDNANGDAGNSANRASFAESQKVSGRQTSGRQLNDTGFIGDSNSSINSNSNNNSNNTSGDNRQGKSFEAHNRHEHPANQATTARI